MTPVAGDAFGTVLRRCWAAGAVAGAAHEIIERDDGHIEAGDAVRYFASPGEWAPVERWAWGRATGRVLDVGCGAGRHALALSEAGHEVVGVDSSPGAVSVAWQRGLTAVVGDAGDLPAGLGTFDTVLLLGNNIGLLGARAAEVLAGLAAVTRPGGQLLGTGLDPHATADPAHLAYHDHNRGQGRLPGQMRLRIRDGVLATDWFDYLFAAPDELRTLVAGTRWQVDHLHEHGPAYAVRLSLT